MSHECNRFLIRDDEFVRDFEAMYACFDDPWNQRATNCTDRGIATAFFLLDVLIRERKRRVEKILDIGCADGYHASRLLALTSGATLVGTDISPTAIERARRRAENQYATFHVDDIRATNEKLVGQFDLIFSSKTLYYVAPEIEWVVDNIVSYLRPGGMLCFVYNQRPDGFTNQWLTYEALREKLLGAGMTEELFVEIDCFAEESTAIGFFDSVSE